MHDLIFSSLKKFKRGWVYALGNGLHKIEGTPKQRYTTLQARAV
jgi:hypothetical protein